jgi:hypothetical protein
VTSSRAHALLYSQTIARLLREDYAAQTQALAARGKSRSTTFLSTNLAIFA